MHNTFFIVETQGHKWLAIPGKWIENINEKISKIFYSPNLNDQSDFTQPTKFFFDARNRACFHAKIVRDVGEYKNEKSLNIT